MLARTTTAVLRQDTNGIAWVAAENDIAKDPHPLFVLAVVERDTLADADRCRHDQVIGLALPEDVAQKPDRLGGGFGLDAQLIHEHQIVLHIVALIQV